MEPGEKLPVFLSWAEERSKAVALALRSWIPMILQNADPWMSAVDLSSGERWSPAIAKRLAASRFGILCLTPENATRPWVLFEAGAIAKAIEQDARVCPYLFGFEKPADVPAGPLSQFQAKLANERETFELVADLNASLGGAGVHPDQLRRLFTALWPQLETELRKVPLSVPSTPRKRTLEDIVPEILDTVRLIERRLPASLDPPLDETAVNLRYRYVLRGQLITEESVEAITTAIGRAFGASLVGIDAMREDGGDLSALAILLSKPLSRPGAAKTLRVLGLPKMSLYNHHGVLIAHSDSAAL